MTSGSVPAAPRAGQLKSHRRGIVAIGCYHFALGTASVPDATGANATVDSRERFYSAIFAG